MSKETAASEAPRALAEILLPESGKRAQVLRKLKGKDLRLAGRASEPGDQIGLAYHLLAQVVQINGSPITGEDLDELDLADVNAIIAGVPGLGKLAPSATATT